MTQPTFRHGTLHGYIGHKCRCDECAEVGRSYYRAYRKLKQQGPIPKTAHGTLAGYRFYACRCDRIPGDERYEAAVIVHIDDLERLTAERDADRAEIVQLCQERLRFTTELDRLRGLLSGSQQELRDAITAQGKAERERDEARDLLRSAIAGEEQLRQQREAESAAYDLLEDERNEAKAAVKRLTAELEQANRGGAELGKTINYLAEVMRATALAYAGQGPTAGMHVLVNYLAEADVLDHDEHAKVWAALQAHEAAEKRAAEASAERTRRELRDSLEGSGT